MTNEEYIVAKQKEQDETDLALTQHIKSALEDAVAAAKEQAEQAQDATSARSQGFVTTGIEQILQNATYMVGIADGVISKLVPPAPLMMPFYVEPLLADEQKVLDEYRASKVENLK